MKLQITENPLTNNFGKTIGQLDSFIFYKLINNQGGKLFILKSTHGKLVCLNQSKDASHYFIDLYDKSVYDENLSEFRNPYDDLIYKIPQNLEKFTYKISIINDNPRLDIHASYNLSNYIRYNLDVESLEDENNIVVKTRKQTEFNLFILERNGKYYVEISALAIKAFENPSALLYYIPPGPYVSDRYISFLDLETMTINKNSKENYCEWIEKSLGKTFQFN